MHAYFFMYETGSQTSRNEDTDNKATGTNQVSSADICDIENGDVLCLWTGQARR